MSRDTFPWWHVGYQWFVLRHRVACFWRDLPWRIACWLPRGVAFCAFIRVYAVLGRCGPEFEEVARLWKEQS